MIQKHVVLEVKKNKYNGQKYINIPKAKDFEEGDYVSIKKVINNNKEKE